MLCSVFLRCNQRDRTKGRWIKQTEWSDLIAFPLLRQCGGRCVRGRKAKISLKLREDAWDQNSLAGSIRSLRDALRHCAVHAVLAICTTRKLLVVPASPNGTPATTTIGSAGLANSSASAVLVAWSTISS